MYEFSFARSKEISKDLVIYNMWLTNKEIHIFSYIHIYSLAKLQLLFILQQKLVFR